MSDGLTEVQMAYNAAQSEMFQLAAYGHHRYHPSGEALTTEGRRQLRDYNDRLLAARDALEAALLRLVAEYTERVDRSFVPVAWLKALADDPGSLSLLAVTPAELEEVLGGEPRLLLDGTLDYDAPPPPAADPDAPLHTGNQLPGSD